VGFNVNSVPKLDWDFSAWLGNDARGITPEPSQKTIESFLEGVQGLAEEVGGVSNLGDDTAMKQAVADKFGAMSEDDQLAKARELQAELIAIMADLTQGSPSATQMENLQATAPRVFKAYMGWLWGSLNPEA
jgi:hypothetical protein